MSFTEINLFGVYVGLGRCHWAAARTAAICGSAGGDPVIAGLNRPGANLTVIAILSAELAPKQLQLLRGRRSRGPGLFRLLHS
jgi:hypothetical protein